MKCYIDQPAGGGIECFTKTEDGVEHDMLHGHGMAGYEAELPVLDKAQKDKFRDKISDVNQWEEALEILDEAEKATCSRAFCHGF